MAVASVRPSRAAILGLAVALLAAGVGCGGAGEARKPDASAGMGGGPGGRGLGGSVEVDTGVPDRPTKQIGETCTTPSDCGSGQCVEGVCCNEACDKACFTCKNPGTEGTCLPAFQGTDPGDRCPTESRTTCGTTGVCDGTGACERFSGNAGVVCAEEACVGFMRTTTGTCDSDGTCSGATTHAVHAVPVCARRQDLPDDVHVGRRLRGAQQLRQRQLRQEADRRYLRQQRRVQFEHLRPGPVLLGRLHRDVQVVRGPRQRGDLPQRPRRSGSARPLRRRQAPRPAGWTGSATGWALAASTRSTRCAGWIRAAWAPSAWRGAATPPARARRACCVRAAPTCAARRTARPAARPAPTA